MGTNNIKIYFNLKLLIVNMLKNAEAIHIAIPKTIKHSGIVFAITL
jgi:hypothetical protein